MKDKEKDKRLLIPGDAFEEEASEGLGRLSREEAEADLRELKGQDGEEAPEAADDMAAGRCGGGDTAGGIGAVCIDLP